MNTQAMASLFDISIDDTLGDKEEFSDQNNTATFETCIKDVQSIMTPETKQEPKKKQPPKDDTKLIKEAIEKPIPKAKATAEETDDDLDIPGDIESDIEATVDADIAELAQATSETEATHSITENTQPITDKDNPLGLDGEDLSAYHKIKDKFPRFRVFDGSLSYRDFYRWKVYTLKNLLVRYPLLDLEKIAKEIKEVKLDHFVGETAISPDLIQQKLDGSYRHRTRVASVLIDIYEQFYAWERFADMLKAKLWKDHDVKGSHRRDGSVLEHMSDVEQYVVEMQGVMESANHADAMLKAATDSLSRQLTCLQMKEQHGLSPRVEKREAPPTGKRHTLDECDSVSDGTVISAPKGNRTAACLVSFGKSDEISELG